MIQTTKIGTAALLFNRASQMGLNPSWLTPNGLFAVTTNFGERYINHEFSSLNSHVSSSLAKNKYHTRIILGRHGFPNIPYAKVKTLEDAEAFLATYKKIIVKPVRGAGSVNISIVSTSAQFANLDIPHSILEQYINGKEMRYLILNGSVIAVHQSKYGKSVDEHRFLERISYNPTTWDSDLAAMSLKIGKVLGLAYAAVDYLIDAKGRSYVLEVNSAPGLKWFHSPSEGPSVDVAKLFLEAMLDKSENS